jgi:hypothetical protein
MLFDRQRFVLAVHKALKEHTETDKTVESGDITYPLRTVRAREETLDSNQEQARPINNPPVEAVGGFSRAEDLVACR